ncbi:hypothetical protein [Pseudomonas sp. zfem003]|uniref:hypothetical protein n=1 Tax=Pseudomonas sp. zfem003 TaxID=3078198 RepID=UPI002928C514|nr:hypothetical protein [Pseudomonas sp. zfem003]MDU9400439.1 hypothetical protein [Pseudomonas sp. zfem003]
MLTKAEIVVGAVAIMDGEVLVADKNVQCSNDHGFIGERPFVCVKVDGDSSVWMLLTATYSKHRLLVNTWKDGGSNGWKSSPTYLNDARKPFAGPSASFIAASSVEINFTHHIRPFIKQPGVGEIIKEIKKYDPGF